MIPSDHELRPQIPVRIRQLLAEPLVKDAAKLALHHLGEIRLRDFFALVPKTGPGSDPAPPAPDFSAPRQPEEDTNPA